MPQPGRWTLVVFDDNAACGCPSLAYELTAYIQHYTHATLAGPSVARAHGLLTLTGGVSGLSSGKVAIQSRSKTGWKTLTLMPVKPDGSFRFTTRVGAPGTYRVRVVFFGDASHLPTSAVYSFKVI